MAKPKIIAEVFRELLAAHPDLPTRLGMPVDSGVLLDVIGAFETTHARVEVSSRADYRRALVLSLLHTEESGFDSDPKAAAKRLVARARVIEEELERVERAELDKLGRPAPGDVARAIIAGPPVGDAGDELP